VALEAEHLRHEPRDLEEVHDLANAVAGACVGAVADPEPGFLRWMREETQRMRAAQGIGSG
jgi:hypothetical protein